MALWQGGQTLPQSFTRDGYQLPSAFRAKLRRLLIGCDGPADSGKSEFALSAPGPGVGLVLDRGIDPVFDNPRPPKTRQPNWGFKVITAPQQTAATQEEFASYWVTFREECKKAALNPDVRTILIDGDSDSWELQRLAAFGKLSQIPSIRYVEVNAARRALYARLWDSGKIIISTNKIKKHYSPRYKADGTPEKDATGKDVRDWDGKTYERQGFDDQEYLWQIQLRHLFDEKEKRWGIRITKCKADADLVGLELWGDECNFATLVQTVYPQVPLSEWGYK